MSDPFLRANRQSRDLTGNPSPRLVKLDPSQPGLSTNSAVKHVLHQVLARYPSPSVPAASIRDPLRHQDDDTGSEEENEERGTLRRRLLGKNAHEPTKETPDDPLSPSAASGCSNDTRQSSTPDSLAASIADHVEVNKAPCDLKSFLGNDVAPVRSA